MEVTGATRAVAEQLMSTHNNDVDRAIEAYFDRVEAEPAEPTESSPAQLPTENMDSLVSSILTNAKQEPAEEPRFQTNGAGRRLGEESTVEPLSTDGSSVQPLGTAPTTTRHLNPISTSWPPSWPQFKIFSQATSVRMQGRYSPHQPTPQ